MNTKVSPFTLQYSGFFIFDPVSKMKYARKKYKGRTIAYLKPSSTYNRIIDYKFIQKIDLMSLDILNTTPERMQPMLKFLGQTKEAKRLALHQLIKEDKHLRLIYKILKRYKSITWLDLAAINHADQLTDTGLYWLRKILRLLNKLENFSFSGLKKNMSHTAICKTFSFLPCLDFLTKVSLEISLNPEFIQVLPIICSLLSLCPKIRYVSLNVKYYELVTEKTFQNIFEPLTKIKYLKEVTVYLGTYNYHIEKPEIVSTSISSFLVNSYFLEVLSLDMRVNESILLRFPFDQSKNLKKLNLSFRESRGLLKDDLSQLSNRLSNCMNLVEFSINLCRCSNLPDDAVRNLCEALTHLPKLQNLTLLIGDKIVNHCNFTFQSIDHISEALYKMKGLVRIELNLSNLTDVSDQNVQRLLQALSYQINLVELRLDLSLCKITYKAFLGMVKNLKELPLLETLELDLYSCKLITVDFFTPFFAMQTKGEKNFKNLHKLMVNLTGTLINKDNSKLYLTYLTKTFPKCYVSLYIR